VQDGDSWLICAAVRHQEAQIESAEQCFNAIYKCRALCKPTSRLLALQCRRDNQLPDGHQVA